MKKFILCSIAALLAGCGSLSNIEQEAGSHPIQTVDIQQSLATDYSEAVIVKTNDFAQTKSYSFCSGVIVSPFVVLTAAHCTYDHTSWYVEAPFVGQKSTASAAKLFDPAPTNWDDNEIDTIHDIGAIILDAPIHLQNYPTFDDNMVDDNTFVLSLGRDLGDKVTETIYTLGISTVSVLPNDFPLAYNANIRLIPGDSGGPVFQYNTHRLIGVNAADQGDAVAIIARIDLVAEWLQSVIIDSEKNFDLTTFKKK